jgi:hypothetical protein
MLEAGTRILAEQVKRGWSSSVRMDRMWRDGGRKQKLRLILWFCVGVAEQVPFLEIGKSESKTRGREI